MATKSYTSSAFRNILLTGLFAGTLDGIAALVLNYKIDPALIFRFIASGVFGKAAFAGGPEMVIAGVIFHYLIALLFTAAFYLVYSFFNGIFKNKYVIAIIYGGTAWLIMNLVVVPLSKIGMHLPNILNIVIGVLVLIICLGLPIALRADKFYSRKN